MDVYAAMGLAVGRGVANVFDHVAIGDAVGRIGINRQRFNDQIWLWRLIWGNRQRIGAVGVAAFSVIQMPDGRVSTSCVWTKGIDTLLPRTSRVAFGEVGKGIVGEAEWDNVTKVMGELLEETELYPSRFRVRSYPSEAQLDAIRKM